MSIVWPVTLPADLILGHPQSAPANVAAFQPMLGAPALYQMGDSPVHTVQGRLRISDAQRVTFRTFYEQTLRMGTRPFEFTSSAFDGETWLCQFAASGAFELTGAAAGWWLQLSLVLLRQLA